MCVCVRFFFRRGKALAFLERQKNGEMDLGVCVCVCVLCSSSQIICLFVYGFFSWRFSLLHLNI